MTDTKISSDLDAGAISGSEIVPIVTGGPGSYVNKRTTAQKIADLVRSLGLDNIFGSTRGSIPYRGSGGWAGLAPGTSGKVLTSGGAGADPSWTSVTALEPFPRFASGRYHTTQMLTGTNAISTTALTANRLYAVPFLVSHATTFTKAAVSVSTLAAATNVEMGIYADNNGVPGALILDIGNVASTSAGVRELTGLSITLSEGLYWLAIASNGGPSLRGLSSSTNSAYPYLGSDALATTVTGVFGSWTYSTGSLPNPFPSITYSPSVQPLMFLGL